MPPSSSLALGHRLLLLLLLATIFQKRLFSKTWTPTLLPTCLLKCAGIFFPILDSLSIHHSRDSKKSGNAKSGFSVRASSRLLRAKRVSSSRQKKAPRVYTTSSALFLSRFVFQNRAARIEGRALFGTCIFFAYFKFAFKHTREREEKRLFLFKSPHKKVVRLDPVL